MVDEKFEKLDPKITYEFPPLKEFKYVDEEGNFIENQQFQELDISVYWRNNFRKVAILGCLAGIIFLIVILNSATIYTNALFNFIVYVFFIPIQFVLGLLPAWMRAYIPI